MKFTTSLSRFYEELWYFHVHIPKDIAEQFIEGKERRVICTLNNAHTFHAGLMPDGKGDYFININKEIRKKLDLQLGVNVEVELKKDESKYGMEMPEELGELLAMDDEGAAYFHALTAGKQRSLIYMVAKPKTTDTRVRKAVTIVDFLKRNSGKLDYKALNEAFKESNRM